MVFNDDLMQMSYYNSEKIGWYVYCIEGEKGEQQKEKVEKKWQEEEENKRTK